MTAGYLWGAIGCFWFLLALNLTLLARSGLPFILREIPIFMSLIFFIGCYWGFESVIGWPVAADLPEKFLYVSYTENGKIIYVWARPIETGKISPEPRAFVVPYEKELADTMSKAKERASKGEGVVMGRGNGHGRGIAEDMGKGGHPGSGMGRNSGPNSNIVIEGGVPLPQKQD